MEGSDVPKFLGLLIVVLCVILSANAALAQISPLCVYTSAESTFQDMTLSGNYNYFNDQSTKGRVDSSGNLTLSFERITDAPSLGFLIDGNAKLSLDQEALSYEVKSKANMRSYWGGSDLFGNGEVETGTVPTAEGVNWGAKARLGVGYGRFRDVTSYSKALRIQTRLIEMKNLLAPLSPEGLYELTGRITQRHEYSDMAALVQQIAELLEQVGKLQRKPLGAVELLRIEEILADKSDNKLCGWDVRVGVGYQLLGPSGQSQNLFLHTEFQYALAPAPRSQFISSIEFDSQLDFMEEHTLSAKANYTYRWGEQIDSNVAYKFQRNKLKKSSPFEMQSLAIRMNFQFQANLNLAIQLHLNHSTGYEEWAQQLLVTMNYDLF
jgi:hypothetical protein